MPGEDGYIIWLTAGEGAGKDKVRYVKVYNIV